MLRRVGWTQASTLNSRSRAYESTGSDGDWALGHKDSRRSIGILRFDGGSSPQAAPGLHGSMCDARFRRDCPLLTPSRRR